MFPTGVSPGGGANLGGFLCVLCLRVCFWHLFALVECLAREDLGWELSERRSRLLALPRNARTRPQTWSHQDSCFPALRRKPGIKKIVSVRRWQQPCPAQEDWTEQREWQDLSSKKRLAPFEKTLCQQIDLQNLLLCSSKIWKTWPCLKPEPNPKFETLGFALVSAWCVPYSKPMMGFHALPVSWNVILARVSPLREQEND